jgi:hypothetical protein
VRPAALRLGAVTLYATPTTAAGLRLTARYLSMRRLDPYHVPGHRDDQRLHLFLLRLSLRNRHPRLKTPELLSILSRAGLTAADVLRLGARGLGALWK